MIAAGVWLFAAAVIAALCNRLRGGWGGDTIRAALGNGAVARIAWGTAGARLGAWGVPAAIGAAVLAVPPAWAACVGLAAALACGTSQFGGLGMGRRPGGPSRAQAAEGMAHWGIARGLAPALILAAWNRWGSGSAEWGWLLAAGALQPAAYEAAYWLPARWLIIPGFGRGSGEHARDYAEVGEVLGGALFGVALVVSLK